MSSNYKLRLATAGAMLLCMLCYFAQGKRAVPVLLVGQILFGLTAMVLVGFVLASTVKKTSPPSAGDQAD